MVSRGVKLTGIAHVRQRKFDFAQRFAAAMQPGIQPPFVRTIRRERRRHPESIRLHAAVDLRTIAANHQTRRTQPRRIAFRQRIRSIHTRRQQFFRMIDLHWP